MAKIEVKLYEYIPVEVILYMLLEAYKSSVTSEAREILVCICATVLKCGSDIADIADNMRIKIIAKNYLDGKIKLE